MRNLLIKRALQVGGAIALLLPSGCAKFPADGGGQNTHLIFRMTVAGHIKNGPTEPTSYIYMVAINASTQLNPITQGPISVIAPPWGNGFVAGNATHFIWYNYLQSNPYLVYQFVTPDLLTYGATGAPINGQSVGPTDRTIQFEVDLSQLVPPGLHVEDIKSVQVNFLTMDRIPQGNDTGQKFWDALGNGADPNQVNDYINIPLNTSTTYSNSTSVDQEPQGDVPDPDLDITDWSVQVVRP